MLIIKTTGLEDYLSGGEAYLKCLMMGAPSAGKTRSASYWPKPIFADCEKGRMSIADRAVPYGEIITTRDMDKMLEILRDECRKPYRDRRYQTLVIDTLDAYQRIVIQERLDNEKKEALSGWADWGYLDGKMSQFVAKLHALPMNIIVNVHVKDATSGEDDSKLTTTGPKLKGDLRDQIAAEFDLVGYMGTYWEAENGERVLKRGVQWHPDPTKPVLKDRSGQLPKWTSVTFSTDDYDTLFTTLTGHLDSLKDSTVLEEHQTDPAINHPPAPPTAGGPVASPITPTPTPRKAAAAPKKAAPAPSAPAGAAPAPAAAGPAASMGLPAAPAQVAPPTAPTTVAAPRTLPPGVPVATKPVIPGATAAPVPAATPEEQDTPAVLSEAADPQPMDEAGVAEALGGQVVSVTETADDSSTGEPPVEQAAEEPVDEPVTETAPDGAIFCGTGYEGNEPTVTGCGTAIVLEKDGGDQQEMLVEIAQLKTRTSLCNACFAAHRAATKKG